MDLRVGNRVERIRPAVGVGGGRGRREWEDVMAARPAGEIEDEGVRRIRLGQGDGPFGPAVGPKKGRYGENAAVLGYLSVRKSGERIEGVSPRCAYA